MIDLLTDNSLVIDGCPVAWQQPVGPGFPRVPHSLSFGHGVSRGFLRPARANRHKGGHWHQRQAHPARETTTNIENVDMRDMADALSDALWRVAVYQHRLCCRSRWRWYLNKDFTPPPPPPCWGWRKGGWGGEDLGQRATWEISKQPTPPGSEWRLAVNSMFWRGGGGGVTWCFTPRQPVWLYQLGGGTFGAVPDAVKWSVDGVMCR